MDSGHYATKYLEDGKTFLKIPYNPYCIYNSTYQNYSLMFIFLNYRKCTGNPLTRGPEIDYISTDPDTTTDNNGSMAC